MITKFFRAKKMLRNLIISFLLFVAVNADGKFAVLNAPSSLDFQGNDPIFGEDVGEIVSAAIGGTVNGDAHWPGLTVVDPFNLPKHAVVAVIDGASVDIMPTKFEYPVEGSGSLESLDLLVTEMKAAKLSTCLIDYNRKKTKSANKCFGISIPNDASLISKTSALNANDDVAEDFLKSVADLNSAVDNFIKQKDSKTVDIKTVVVLRLSLTPIVNKYGSSSVEMAEAVDLVQKSISKLHKASGDALFIVVSGTDESTKSRTKREVVEADPKNPYNLAKYYDADYPVIFNIIFWFMIVFGLALLAISYAIGSMDPGRDSIIYRMTSTRMKKDN